MKLPQLVLKATKELVGVKMQDFKFHSYVEFYDHLTDEHKVMVTILKEMIHDNLPGVKEKLSWNVPFFYRSKTICFIWPGSIPWGKKVKEGVELGFTKGFLMRPNDYLEKGNRKKIYTKTFYNVQEIEDDAATLTALLSEANELDT